MMNDRYRLYRKASLMIISIAASSMLALLAFFIRQQLAQPDFNNAYLYPESSRDINEFTLIKANQQSFEKKDLSGKWSFIFFGYTHCPDICPLTLYSMKQIADQLKRDNADHNTQFLFISIDPARDQPALLKNYVEYFEPSFLALSGNQQQLRHISKIFDTTFNKINNPESSESYFMSHANAIYITNPEMKRFALLPAPHNPGEIVSDFYLMQAL